MKTFCKIITTYECEVESVSSVLLSFLLSAFGLVSPALDYSP